MSGIATFAPAPIKDIADGAQALAGGTVFLTRMRTVIAADIHFGYEEVIGGALPLWSIDESVRRLEETVRLVNASELVLLGDVVHGPNVSEGAARRIHAALAALRGLCTLTIIAGNHEGRGNALHLLGDTHEVIERDGWHLLHGDDILQGHRCIIGHLHPSLQLGGGKTAPVVLASPSLLVVPALTPYSPGLNICSRAAQDALRPWRGADQEELTVFGVAGRQVYPFGPLDVLCRELHAKRVRPRLRLPKRFPS